MRAPTFGFTEKVRSQGTILTVPDRYPFLAMYLSFLECILITMATSPNLASKSGPDFELPGFVVYGGMIALTVLIILCLTNSIQVTRTHQAIALTRFFLGIPRKTEFNLAHVRNMRVYGPLKNNKNSHKFQVLFDYGQETITLAKRMSQPSARLLADKLMAQKPA
jgi:hypothetical protein